MTPDEWDRMGWYSRQRYQARQRRAQEADQPVTAPPAAPPVHVLDPPRLTRYRNVWTVYDGVCTAKFGNEAAARWFIHQLRRRR